MPPADPFKEYARRTTVADACIPSPCGLGLGLVQDEVGPPMEEPATAVSAAPSISEESMETEEGLGEEAYGYSEHNQVSCGVDRRTGERPVHAGDAG